MDQCNLGAGDELFERYVPPLLAGVVEHVDVLLVDGGDVCPPSPDRESHDTCRCWRVGDHCR
jgi:hypothetical protein